MKIMLDTNVLISAFVFGGKTGNLLIKLLSSGHELLVSEYIDKELKEKLELKWPDKAEKVYELYHEMDFCFYASVNQKLGVLRDEKDIPVLSDALYQGVDIILTGDRDFLEADLEKPLIFSPAMLEEFLNNE